MIQQLLSAGLGSAVDNVLGRFFEDKDQAAKAAHELRLEMAKYENNALQAARDVVVAEAKSEHSITSMWRPITMLVFVAIIANNYAIAPYLDAMFGVGLMLELPDHIWELVKIGLGGYVVGRSGEKIAKEVGKKKG